MISKITHIGVTVSDLDRSLEFYKDILGLSFQGELVMKGPETDLLFDLENCEARIAYLGANDHLMSPSVELIQFVNQPATPDKASLTKTSISEICFEVDDIDQAYEDLLAKGVNFLSQPQTFDFTDFGFSKSRAVYFRDPDGIILELIQTLE